MSREAMELLPCPFCGGWKVSIAEGSTFRWRLAVCEACGAQGPEERIQTTGDGTKEEWEANCAKRVAESWNRRSALAAQEGKQ